MPRPSRRSAEADLYRSLYKTSAWRKGRVIFLAQHPLCERCQTVHGRVTAASEVHHRRPHKGDTALFFDWSNWQALCKPCHDGPTQSEEIAGRLMGSIDGRPRDPDHPWNAGHVDRRDGLGPISHPVWFRPLRVPLIIVCGPPASGKTAYVRAHAAPSDLILDLDDIALALYGGPLPSLSSDQALKCLKYRNARLADLMRATGVATPSRAWLIVSEPHAHKRQWWADRLKPERIVVMATPADECIRRAAADRSGHRKADVDNAIREWWDVYKPRDGDTVIG